MLKKYKKKVLEISRGIGNAIALPIPLFKKNVGF
jgi:hypothetical protein